MRVYPLERQGNGHQLRWKLSARYTISVVYILSHTPLSMIPVGIESYGSGLKSYVGSEDYLVVEVESLSFP